MEIEVFDTETVRAVSSEFAYLSHEDKYVLRGKGRWMLDSKLSDKALLRYLTSIGHDPEVVAYAIKNNKIQAVIGDVVSVSAAPVVNIAGHKYLNLYVPPTIQPTPGPYPRIEAVLDWLTKGDAAGKVWLVNWIACKVQNPASRPMVAVVLNGSQGSGKGTFYSVMAEMLGRENCASVTEGSLKNKFNARWSSKLFVLADEVMAGETHKTISEKLKVLVTGDNGVEQEKKGRDQTSVKNQIAWVFASNDAAHPVRVEKGDRRFSVFTNFDARTDEYKELTKSCFNAEGDRSQFREDFKPEVAGFMYACLNMKADPDVAATVFQNESRGVLLSASMSPTDSFFDKIETISGAMDNLLDHVADHDEHVRTQDRASWDFGDVVSTDVFYRAYLAHCSKDGLKYPQTKQKFGAYVKARGYEVFRPLDPVSKRQVYAYRGPWLRGEPKVEVKSNNVVPMKGR